MAITPIAELTLRATEPSGREGVVSVSVMAPERVDEHEWRCPVEVHGLGRDASGAVSAGDSLQALCLGLWFVAAHLRSMKREGARLAFIPDATDDDATEALEFPIDAYFGSLGTQ